MRKAGFDFFDVRDFANNSSRPSIKKGRRDELRRDSSGVGVYLHGNQIGYFDKVNRNLRITHAGWRTNTTKARLNKLINHTGSQVRQRKHVWYVEGSNYKEPFDNWFNFKQ